MHRAQLPDKHGRTPQWDAPVLAFHTKDEADREK
jgi:hypothetical protein